MNNRVLTTSRTPPLFVLASALLIGVVLRLLAASVFDNYDMESWWIASEAVLAGEPVYAATHRYNYGPIWSYIIGALRSLSKLTGADTITRLHLFMTAFLTLSDIGLSFILWRLTSPSIALLFFLNPISIIVTGYHIQFDNLAILIGLAGWFVFTNGASWSATAIGSLLFGASLSMKHVFSLFLAWLPFLTEVRTLRHRIAFGAVSLSVFVASFLPWFDHPAAWAGIRANVFAYTSTEGHSLTSALASALSVGSPRSLFMILAALTGLVFIHRHNLHRVAPFVYLIALTALSSGMARNYLAVPLVGIFYFLTVRPSMLYLLLGLTALVTVNTSLGSPEVIVKLSSTQLCTYELVQCALILLIVKLYRCTREEHSSV